MEEEKKQEEQELIQETCGSGRSCCTNPQTEEPHSCPYTCDVNGDWDFECYCCEDCESECGADI